MMLDTSVYLGPARVLATATKPGYVRVELANDDVLWARLALAVPYRPEPGDEVLVICQEPPDAFVIGVLEGCGTTTLSVPGDLRLEAPQGEVSIMAGMSVKVRSAQAIEMAAPRATFRFARLNMLVTTLVQRLANSFTWATGLMQSKSQRLRQLAEEGWLVRAGRAHVKTTDNIHINGKTIHLG
jgi:hypothetical protein